MMAERVMQGSYLNIGSGAPKGSYKQDIWVNIDIHDIPGTFKMDVFEMPNAWKDSFMQVRAIHCLEHVNRNRRLEFLQQCYRVLAPNGVCYIEVPNFEMTIQNLHHAIKKGDHDLEHRMTTSVFGKQRYPGDQHCWGFTSRTLSDLARQAGFNVMSVVQLGPRNAPIQDPLSEHYAQEDVLVATLLKTAR